MKIFKRLIIALFAVLLTFSAVSCSPFREVEMPIGDGATPNDAVTCKFKIAGKLTDDYKLEGYITAESAADLDDRFLLTVSITDRFTDNYSEKVLLGVTGSQITAAKNKLKFSVSFGKLSDLIPADASTFHINFKREGATKADVTMWSEVDFNYEWKNDKVIIKD